jgi:hypothetical protein
VASVKNQHIAGVLGVFVVFYILTSPENAADQTRDFVSWLGDGAQALETFVQGLTADNA